MSNSRVDFFNAIRNKDYDGVKDLLEDDTNPQDTNQIFARGERFDATADLGPLHLAAKCGHKKIMELLLEKGANPNLLASLKTPLYYAFTYAAAHNDDARPATLLLENGADTHSNPNWFWLKRKGYENLAAIVEGDEQICFRQDWIAYFLEALEYKYVDFRGNCHGMAHMATQAIQLREADIFNERLKQMCEIYIRAETITLLGNNINPQTDFMPEITKEHGKMMKKIENDLLKNIAKEFENEFKIEYTDANKTEIDFDATPKYVIQNKNDILAFCDGIVLYQDQNKNKYSKITKAKMDNSDEYKHEDVNYLYNKKPVTSLQVDQLVKELVRPIDQEDGMELCTHFTGAYTLKELEEYIQIFSELAEQEDISDPISLILRSIDHTININYDREKQEWYFTDANRMPIQRFKEEEYAIDSSKIETISGVLARKVVNAFQSNDCAIFSTSVYCSRKDTDEVKSFLVSLRGDEKWQALHKVTPERAKLRGGDGYSWRETASELGDPPALKALQSLNIVKSVGMGIATLGLFQLDQRLTLFQAKRRSEIFTPETKKNNTPGNK